MSRHVSSGPGSALLEAVAVMDRLRSPGGCPWDAEQTHASLARYAIEEAHEVAEAAESGDVAALREELGDLLLQVLFHARVAAEATDGFDIDDVARELVAKLRRRHPHVFASRSEPANQLSAADVEAQWTQIKAAEKQRASVLDGIPVGLPALARAQKVVSRAAKARSAVGPEEPAPHEGAAPAAHAAAETTGEARIGAALLATVREAEALGVDAEAALRAQVRDLEAQIRATQGSAAAV